MTAATSLRLFLAASVPDDHLRRVAEETAPLEHRWPDARWIPLENQHVTLKFLGSTPEGRLGDVVSVCDEVAARHATAALRLNELGVFPSAKRARVLWVGLHDPDGLLRSLAMALSDGLAPLGFEPEERPYSPHLTVARFKTPTAVRDLPEVVGSPAPFLLEAFDLWRSRLSPKGARYERLASFPFGAIDCAS